MPWCPSCSFEFPAGKKKCPECGQPIRNAQNQESIRFKDRNWMSIREVPDPIQGEFMRNFLKSNGFDVAIRNGDGEINLKVKPTSTKVHILVPTESARAAATLLRADMSSPAEDDLEDEVIEHDELAEEEELLPEDEEAVFGRTDDLVISYDDDEEFV
jgi:hypothetical protein